MSKLCISELMNYLEVHEQRMNKVLYTLNLEQTFQLKGNKRNTRRYERDESSNKFHGGRGGGRDKENNNGDGENYKRNE